MNQNHPDFITVDAGDLSNDRDFDDDHMVMEPKRSELNSF